MITFGETPTDFDPRSTILFLGAGFSAEATNLLDKGMPVGSGENSLEMNLRQILDLSTEDGGDLKDLSEQAVAEGVDLHALLSEIYTTKTNTENQRTIASQDWRRVYTTNYDDVFEASFREVKSVLPPSFVVDDVGPNKLPRNAIIHLHGYIHRCNMENVSRQLVLTHHSYVEQIVKKSFWWEQFDRDLRTAENIIFVGYSLNDFRIDSYLNQNPEFTERTHVVLRGAPAKLVYGRISKYGAIYTGGTSAFARACSLALPRPPATAEMLRSFTALSADKDRQSVSRPTTLEIEALLSRGKFSIRRMWDTYPRPEYISPRRTRTVPVLSDLKSVKTVVVHAKTGNGKSIFRHILCYELERLGYRCFQSKNNATIPDDEIEFLSKQGKVCVVFDDYDTAYDVVPLLEGASNGMLIVLEISTRTFLVRQAELHATLPRPMKSIDLDGVEASEFEEIEKLLRTAGLPSVSNLRSSRKVSDLRDIILSLFNNEKVRSGIEKHLSAIVADQDARAAAMCSFILKAAGISADPNFIRSAIACDPFECLLRHPEFVHEFFAISSDRIEPFSATLSEYLLSSYFTTRELVQMISQCIEEAASRLATSSRLNDPRTRYARSIFGSLMRHSYLLQTFVNASDRDSVIGDLYERWRANDRIQVEPLFWLQYGIFASSIGHRLLAEKLIETAYDRAAERPGFRTYQLDTFSFKLLIEIETIDYKGMSVARFDSIYDKLTRIVSMLDDGNHRFHAIEVLGGVTGFIEARKGDLSLGEINKLVFRLRSAQQTLQAFKPEWKARLGSDRIAVGLERSISALKT